MVCRVDVACDGEAGRKGSEVGEGRQQGGGWCDGDRHNNDEYVPLLKN